MYKAGGMFAVIFVLDQLNFRYYCYLIFWAVDKVSCGSCSCRLA